MDRVSEVAPRRLILTLYGLYARDEHNWLSVNVVVRLMGFLGVEPPGVRSSIARLKRRGTLESMRIGSAAGYSLSEQALGLLREGDVRIFERRRSSESDGLVLVVYSIPESERRQRHELRKTLTAMGFGTVSPGVWVAPGAVFDEAIRVLEHRGLDRYVDMFRARYEQFGALADRVARWWDLASIAREYDDFVERYAECLTNWRVSREGPQQAFQVYVPMLTDWRRLPYRDPGLPVSVLPGSWAGFRAQELFADLNALLRTPAREFALSVIHA